MTPKELTVSRSQLAAQRRDVQWSGRNSRRSKRIHRSPKELSRVPEGTPSGGALAPRREQFSRIDAMAAPGAGKSLCSATKALHLSWEAMTVDRERTSRVCELTRGAGKEFTEAVN